MKKHLMLLLVISLFSQRIFTADQEPRPLGSWNITPDRKHRHDREKTKNNPTKSTPEKIKNCTAAVALEKMGAKSPKTSKRNLNNIL